MSVLTSQKRRPGMFSGVGLPPDRSRHSGSALPAPLSPAPGEPHQTANGPVHCAVQTSLWALITVVTYQKFELRTFWLKEEALRQRWPMHVALQEEKKIQPPRFCGTCLTEKFDRPGTPFRNVWSTIAQEAAPSERVPGCTFGAAHRTKTLCTRCAMEGALAISLAGRTSV